MFEDGQNIFERCVGLYEVSEGKYIPRAGKIANQFVNVSADIVRTALYQNLLGVNAPVETDLAGELLLQPLRLHTHSRSLYRI